MMRSVKGSEMLPNLNSEVFPDVKKNRIVLAPPNVVNNKATIDPRYRNRTVSRASSVLPRGAHPLLAHTVGRLMRSWFA